RRHDVAVGVAVAGLLPVRKTVDQQEVEDLIFPGARRRMHAAGGQLRAKIQIGKANGIHGLPPIPGAEWSLSTWADFEEGAESGHECSVRRGVGAGLAG